MPQSRVVERQEGSTGEDGSPGSFDQWYARIADRFDAKEQYLIPMLQHVQGEVGYLTPEAMRAVARYLRVPESKVYGVASFYAQFYFEPRGRNTLTICRGTACHVRGSGRLLREMEGHLGVESGEATQDKSFSLETVACFGACALAPVVVINEQVHRQQTTTSLKKLVDGVRAQASGPKTKRKKKKKSGSRAAGKKGRARA